MVVEGAPTTRTNMIHHAHGFLPDAAGAPPYAMGTGSGMPYGGNMPYGAGGNEGNFNQMQMAPNMYSGQMYPGAMPGGPRPQIMPFPGNMAAQPRGAVPYQV